VVLKTAESVVAPAFAHMTKEELKHDLLAPLLRLAVHDFRDCGASRDGSIGKSTGRRPLLGVAGVCFIGQRQQPDARVSGARSAPWCDFVEQRVNEHIREEIQADHVSAA